MLNEEAKASPMVAVDRRSTAIVLSVLIALKIGFLFAYAWTGRFVMDEFVQLGWAKYLSNGLFSTIWPIKAVGYAVFYKLAHLLGWSATSILLIGRIQTALLGCAIVAIVFACARSLGQSRLRALLIVLLLLSFSNFLERIFRTIAEPLAVFFAAAALLVVLRGGAGRARTVVLAGALSGLAFITTQKSIYFNVALGIALTADAALMRHYANAVARGAWLVLGWLAPIIAYCVIFGGSNAPAVALNLLFGPVEVATQIGAEYIGLRRYVAQTLVLNAVLYAFCFAGMALELFRVTKLGERRRIALFFTVLVTALVFAHDQPWPYVFVMAQPFIALWALVPFDRFAAKPKYLPLVWLALAFGIAMSFARNIQYLRLDNSDQLELVARAEASLGPGDVYFDGIGMLPNRAEPTPLWLDKHYVRATLREGKRSEAYRIFASSPPKLVLWSYRMNRIYPVVGPLIRDSYVQVAPNLRLAGRRLELGEPTVFDVPVAGPYALYSESGRPLDGCVELDGAVATPPLELKRGRKTVTLRCGPAVALLLPRGSYAGRFERGPDNKLLFADIYN